MLALRIAATVCMGISCMTCLMKNINIFSDTKHPNGTASIELAIATIYGWLWRAFVIIAIWKI
jgi:hypothetical protein